MAQTKCLYHCEPLFQAGYVFAIFARADRRTRRGSAPAGAGRGSCRHDFAHSKVFGMRILVR
jgi:hypothetical protein